ncbi:MAG: hypothetical protein ACFFCS_11005, partial [Candidatus Hodarchaeota archaeon]
MENQRKLKFDGKRIIRDVLVADFIVFATLAIQFAYFYISNNAIFFDIIFEFYFSVAACVLCLLGVKYRTNLLYSIVNSIIFAFCGVLSFLVLLIFNGPFDSLMFALGTVMLVLNLTAFVINLSTQIRTHWRKNFIKTFNWGRVSGKRVVQVLSVMGLIAFFAIGSAFSFWYQYTVRAPDGARTTSSFWGSPDLDKEEWSSIIAVSDNYTLQVDNTTLVDDPPGFLDGSFAYVKNVTFVGDTFNYCNYSEGAESYPNGTVFLSTPLPNFTNVNISFYYVNNSKLLQDLSYCNSTIHLTDRGDFIYHSNPFLYISTTYKFQLMEYYNISFYMSVDHSSGYPTAFNYQDYVPECYQTLDWGKQWDHFLGLSIDFEGGPTAIPTGSPGGVELPLGSLYPEDRTFPDIDRLHWYFINEQNETLFHDAWLAYEGVYAYASYLGLKTYAIISDEGLYELIDDDMDCHRLPIVPITKNPDVLFGVMSYQQNNSYLRFKMYRDCVDQISIFGDRGRSLLTGWIELESTWYTNDDTGFDRYVEDLLIAQAAGMEEVFHGHLRGV